jgi:DNA-binding transcriptional regulator YiaG
MEQKDAARLLGVGKSTLCAWEKGNKQPRGRFHSRLVDFLGEGKGAL